jgi:hypothetical protein
MGTSEVSNGLEDGPRTFSINTEQAGELALPWRGLAYNDRRISCRFSEYSSLLTRPFDFNCSSYSSLGAGLHEAEPSRAKYFAASAAGRMASSNPYLVEAPGNLNSR